MQAIERIRTALQKHAAAKTLAEAWILADENEDALSVESLTEVLAHIDQLRAEIHASDLAVAEYRQQCIDNAQEIARLRAESEERLQNCVALVAENERLRKDAELMKKGLDAVEELINDSSGVAGLHQNGDIASWSELRTGGRFEAWLLAFDDGREAAMKGTP